MFYNTNWVIFKINCNLVVSLSTLYVRQRHLMVTCYFTANSRNPGEHQQKAKNEVRSVLPAGRLPGTTVKDVMNLAKDCEKKCRVIGKGSKFPELLSSDTAPASVSTLWPWDSLWPCSLNLPDDNLLKAFLTKDSRRVKNIIWFFQVPRYQCIHTNKTNPKCPMFV